MVQKKPVKIIDSFKLTCFTCWLREGFIKSMKIILILSSVWDEACDRMLKQLGELKKRHLSEPARCL